MVEGQIQPYKHAIALYGTAMLGLPTNFPWQLGKKLPRLPWQAHSGYLTTLVNTLIKTTLARVGLVQNNQKED